MIESGIFLSLNGEITLFPPHSGSAQQEKHAKALAKAGQQRAEQRVERLTEQFKALGIEPPD